MRTADRQANLLMCSCGKAVGCYKDGKLELNIPPSKDQVVMGLTPGNGPPAWECSCTDSKLVIRGEDMERLDPLSAGKGQADE